MLSSSNVPATVRSSLAHSRIPRRVWGSGGSDPQGCPRSGLPIPKGTSRGAAGGAGPRGGASGRDPPPRDPPPPRPTSLRAGSASASVPALRSTLCTPRRRSVSSRVEARQLGGVGGFVGGRGPGETGAPPGARCRPESVPGGGQSRCLWSP